MHDGSVIRTDLRPACGIAVQAIRFFLLTACLIPLLVSGGAICGLQPPQADRRQRAPPPWPSIRTRRAESIDDPLSIIIMIIESRSHGSAASRRQSSRGRMQAMIKAADRHLQPERSSHSDGKLRKISTG